MLRWMIAIAVGLGLFWAAVAALLGAPVTAVIIIGLVAANVGAFIVALFAGTAHSRE